MALRYQSKVLTVMNSKGGCSKSTTASILAEYFGLIAGKNVLLIDLDQQSNTSDLWVGMDINDNGDQVPPLHPEYDAETDEGIYDPRSSIADIYWGKQVLTHETFINSEKNGTKGNVEVVVASPELLELVNSEFDNKSGELEKRIINRLQEFLHDDSVVPHYDIIILDTGPTKSALFRSCLRAATHLIIPSQMESKSIQGINSMITQVKNESATRSVKDEVKIIGILPTMVRMNTNIHKSNFERLHLKLPQLMIPKDIYVSLSTSIPERDLKNINPRSIFHIPKSHISRIQCEALGRYVEQQIFGDS